MRRWIMLTLVSTFVLVVGSPAQAAKPTKTTYDSVSANAFWTTEEQLSPTTVKRTTWYVGVYQSTDGTFSDLYVDTSTCTQGPRGENCTYDSMSGYSELSDAVFTIDDENLTVAHLEETYLLESWDKDGNPSESFTATIVADWAGVGEVWRNSGKSSYCDKYVCYKSTFEDAFRSAEAAGTVNGEDLGETYDAYLSSSHSESMEWKK
jgi:hypothetical protein